MAADPAKDQSYVLYTLGQAQLARVRFPLGDLAKTETRRIAVELGLQVADKPDSADICFVPGGDYRELLQARSVTSRSGAIVATDGAELGRHDGVAGFTVGQRRGLGLTSAERRYVTAIGRPLGHRPGRPGAGSVRDASGGLEPELGGTAAASR